MHADEWCAVAHVDISPRTSLEDGVELLLELAAGAVSTTGVLDYAVLRQPVRQNHFELVGRFATEAAYLAHLGSPCNVAFRAAIAPMLGSPYEDRLHGGRGPQRFPLAAAGAFVIVTQLEVQPVHLTVAERALEGLVEAQAAAEGLGGQVLLARRGRPNNLELLSVWAGEEAFDAHLAAEAYTEARAVLTPMLVAPVDDRRHHLLAGALRAP
ncbi:MAG TPA: antibiotic biosynthesis monooxygenase [Acidimicrobiales bacterium]|nr:antibiotic biosynthesis monooxygenase [Acidimicrobiales bacterium]